MATELTALVFALDREVMDLRRQLGPLSPLRDAPCPAWRSARGPVLLVTGMGAGAAERAVMWLLSGAVGRPARVLSGGFAGGLVEGLHVGAVVWPARVTAEGGESWPLAAPAGVASVGLVSAAAIVGGAAARRELGERSGAAVVDMETATVARLCQAAGVGVTSLRVVSDTPGRPPHPALIAALTGESVSPLRLAGAVLRRPWLVAELTRLARDTRRAARALAEGVREWLAWGDTSTKCR